ncbi:tetratricopeptide repeat protein [Dethiobacter alkaliphilus]|uniref:Tetratricopeptide TPR_2 repeat protein n=1 Tax=Dethiobacter alkaliphilus AHT 1 TaxID=555088 RepID=C0GII4_DETAL|nr:tetratricopeptide repeat protein [Dethiobacter alkaliphilus]EEG76845.1 Tetratricopeptide TPR_2 repeat protein [Dethiobacter alkaliphilus AHT 1]
MSEEMEQESREPASYELPWPRELSQGLAPGLLWAVTSFFLFLVYFWYGVASLALMFIFFQTQRNTPVGRARRFYVQGRQEYRKKNYTEALENFHKALEIKPDATVIYPVIGDLYFFREEIAKAKNAYQDYFRRMPEDHDMRIWYAGKFLERGQFAEAVKELKKLPAEVRRTPQVVNLLALCLLKSSQNKEAIQILEPAVRKNESDDEHLLTSRYFLAKAYLQDGQKETARSLLQKLEEEHPGLEDVPQLLSSLNK